MIGRPEIECRARHCLGRGPMTRADQCLRIACLLLIASGAWWFGERIVSGLLQLHTGNF